MSKELTRRDFLKVAAKVASAGAKALVLGGALSACGEKDARCDTKNTVTLNEGDYVIAGEFKVILDYPLYVSEYDDQGRLIRSLPNKRKYAYFEIINMPEYKRHSERWEELQKRVEANGGTVTVGSKEDWEQHKLIGEYKTIVEEKSIEIGDFVLFGHNSWTIYRCDENTFSFWETENFPISTPTPTLEPPEPTATPANTPSPAAIFP